MIRKFKLSDRNITLIFGILSVKIWLLVAVILGSAFWGTAVANESSAFEEQELLLAEVSQNSYLEMDERIAATIELGHYYGVNAMIAISRASRSDNASLRVASIKATKYWQINSKWDLVSPLLKDEQQPVKAQAVRALVAFMPKLPKQEKELLQNSISKHLQNLPVTLESGLEKAWFYSAQGDFSGAEKQYQKLLNEEKDVRIIIGYAELLKQQKKDQQALALLNENINKYSDNASLHYSLGLNYHRLGDFKNSKVHLALANELDPENPTYGFAYAIALQGDKSEKSIALLEVVYQQQPQANYLYALCDALLNEGRDAQHCLNELTKKVPGDVVNELNQRYQPLIENNQNDIG